MSRFHIAIVPVIWICGLTPASLTARSLLEAESPGEIILLSAADSAVLESEDVRKDLPCTVRPLEPFLGFDLRFHSIYEVTVPIEKLAGPGDDLTIVLRVERRGGDGEGEYFFQHFPVPETAKDARGGVRLEGGFDLGEGRYRVHLMMRDRRDRICSFHWDAEAVLRYQDQNMRLAIQAGHIEAFDQRLFHAEPPVARLKTRDGLKVKILVNFAPQRSNQAGMPVTDMIGLVSILRNIAREPRISKFSVVAFSMNEQRVVYRQEDADEIDFPALGWSIASLKPGVIEYGHLIDPGSGTSFLSRLIENELANTDADALVFASPKVMLDERHPIRKLNAQTVSPVFYLNYNLIPDEIPWRDAIGKVVKHLRGVEYTISCPHDIWTSWADVMARVTERKRASTADASSR